MKVILTQDVKKLGKKDEMVDVSEGYANNFLFRQNLAVPADKANINKVNSNRRKEEEKKAGELELAKEQAEAIKKGNYKVKLKVGQNGKLFGSVTNIAVSELIENETGIKVDKRKISVPDSMKSLGIYEVLVKLHPEVSFNIKLEVNGE